MGLCEKLRNAKAICPGLSGKTYICATYLASFCSDDMSAKDFTVAVLEACIDVCLGETIYGKVELPMVLANNTKEAREAFQGILNIVEKMDKDLYASVCSACGCIRGLDVSNGEVLLDERTEPVVTEPDSVVAVVAPVPEKKVYRDGVNYPDYVNGALEWIINEIGEDKIEKIILTFRDMVWRKIRSSRQDNGNCRMNFSDIANILSELEERAGGNFKYDFVIDKNITMDIGPDMVRVWRGIGSPSTMVWRRKPN